MTLGLPAHLPPRTTSRAFISALHAIAVTFLIGALLVVVSFQAEWPGLIMWPAMVALVPMLVALYFTERTKTVLFTVAYLVIGGAAVYWYSLTFATQLPLGEMPAATTLALPKIALLLVGGTGSRTISAFGWSSAGFLVGGVAAAIGVVQAGQSWRFDESTFAAYVILMSVVTVSWFGQRGANRSQALLQSAAREELVAALRHRIEVRAAALLHDTVLNHLTAIANSTDSSMTQTLFAQVRRDLSLLDGPEWLSDADAADKAVNMRDWESSGVFQAIDEAQDLGLTVDVTGDLGALSRLDAASSRELGLAVKQCLVNVVNHAGTMDAEVAVHSSDHELLLMVVDTGRGFEPAETSADRLGLKNSVLGRLESIGGSAQIWSTPGRGTSVVLRLPLESATMTPQASGGAA